MVTTASHVLPPGQPTVPMSRLKECLAMEQCYDFLQSSKHVEMDPAIWRLAIDATMEEQDAWQAAVKMTGVRKLGFRVRNRVDHREYADRRSDREAERRMPGFHPRHARHVPQPENPGAVCERLSL